MNRIFLKIFTCVWFIVVLCQSRELVADEFDYILGVRTGWSLFKLNNYDQAAKFWSSESLKIVEGNRDEESLQSAGLLEILSAVAYEKANNAEAYHHWSTGVSYFIQGKTRWENYREKLRAYYEKEMRRLGQVVSGENAAGVLLPTSENQSAALLFLEIEKAISLTQYNGPEPNLAVRAESQTDTILPRRSYISRPLFAIDDVNVDDVYVDSEVAEEAGSSADFGPVTMTRRSLKGIAFDEEQEASLDSTARVIPTPSVQPETQIQIKVIERFNRMNVGAEALEQARLAWQFFKNNENETGFFNGSSSSDIVDVWSLGSSLAAIVTAREFKLLKPEDFDDVMLRFLDSLLKASLNDDSLFEYAYHSGSLENAAGPKKNTGENVIWSGVGLGRLLIWLKIISIWYPGYDVITKNIVERLNLTAAFDSRGVHQKFVTNGVMRQNVVTTVGYSHYSSIGYRLWNVPGKAMDFRDFPEAEIYRIPIHYDGKAVTELVVDPYFLAKIEVSGISSEMSDQVTKIYQVQKAHSYMLKKPVASTENIILGGQWSQYFSIYSGSDSWVLIDSQGQLEANRQGYGTHGLFLMDALFNDHHSKKWINEVNGMSNAEQGYFNGKHHSGELMETVSANTNGIILESLLYQHITKEPFVSLVP